MRQFLPLIFGFVTFLSLLGSTQMIDFCNAFEDNGYNISYGFTRIRFYDLSWNYIFIGDYYWELSFVDNEDESKMNVTLVSNDSKRADNWIGSNYSMALCVVTTFQEDNYCTTYLLHKSQEYWEYGFLDNDRSELKMSETKEMIDVSNRSVLENGTIGFGSTFEGKMSGFIVLFNQRESYYDVYKPQSKEEDPIKYKSDGEKSKYQSLQNLTESGEIVAILRQFSREKLVSSKQLEPGHGFIILFKVEKSLKYCCTHITTLSQTCIPQNQRILINCSKLVSTPITTPLITPLITRLTTTEETDTESDYKVVIILSVMVIVIFLITAFIVIIVFIREKAKKEPPLKGLKTPKIKDKYFQSYFLSKQKDKEEKPKEVVASKSETFKPEINVDYSTPIPLESATDVNISDTNIRPTDLVIQKN